MAWPVPRLPPGMTEVTRAEFFTALTADQRDVMPSNQNREFTLWIDSDGKLFGWSTPGWANPGGSKHYAIVAKFIAGSTPCKQLGL